MPSKKHRKMLDRSQATVYSRSYMQTCSVCKLGKLDLGYSKRPQSPIWLLGPCAKDPGSFLLNKKRYKSGEHRA